MMYFQVKMPAFRSISKDTLARDVQWNPYIAYTIGEVRFGCYKEVAFVEGLYFF